MATHDLPILGAMTSPDSSGDVFFEPVETALTLATAVYDTLLGLTMIAPTGADTGVYGAFTVPQNYVGTPVLVIRGVLGEAASTLAFGFSKRGLAVSESFDQAFETADLANNTVWTGFAANDVYEETIALLGTLAAGDVVPFFFFRDDSVDTQTAAFVMTELLFRYNDA